MPMPRTCFLKCVEKSELFVLPTEEPQRSQWLKCLFNTVPSEVRRTLLCARHFTDESFQNIAQFEAGYAQHLKLKDDAIPSLFGPFGAGEDSGTQPVSLHCYLCIYQTRYLPRLFKCVNMFRTAKPVLTKLLVFPYINSNISRSPYIHVPHSWIMSAFTHEIVIDSILRVIYRSVSRET